MDLRLLLQLIGIVAYSLINLKEYFLKKNIYDIIICTCKEFFFQVLSALEELEKREEECRAAHELVLLRRFM